MLCDFFAKSIATARSAKIVLKSGRLGGRSFRAPGSYGGTEALQKPPTLSRAEAPGCRSGVCTGMETGRGMPQRDRERSLIIILLTTAKIITIIIEVTIISIIIIMRESERERERERETCFSAWHSG